MEINNEISEYLLQILESHICAIGSPYPDYFKENKIAKQAYELLRNKENSNVSEKGKPMSNEKILKLLHKECVKLDDVSPADKCQIYWNKGTKKALISIPDSFCSDLKFDSDKYLKELKERLLKNENIKEVQIDSEISAPREDGWYKITSKDKIEESLNEATPKSTLEKMHRKTRIKKNKKHKFHEPNMLGKITPKKTGNSDPRRGGNRACLNQISENLQKSIYFLRDNVKKTKKKINESLNDFKYKKTLHSLVNNMIAIGMGGWKITDNGFINESGRIVNKDNWKLKNDRLISKDGKEPNFDTGWLLDLKEQLEDKLNND